MPLEVSVPNVEKGGPIGGNVRYCVKTRNGANTTESYKRYSEFEALHKALSAQFGAAKCPNMPPKKMFGNMNAQFVEQRREELEALIKTIVGDASIVNQSEALWGFLDVIPPTVVVARFIDAVGKGGAATTEVTGVAELSEDPETWAELTKKECLQALVKLVQATTDEAVQQSCCRLMVNLTRETANRQALIEAGGFPACLRLSIHAENNRVQQAVQHIINQMALPDTVISVIDCGGMNDLQRLAANEPRGQEILRTAALCAWRASVNSAGRASLLDRGVLTLLQQLAGSTSVVAQYLGHLVAATLVMEVGASGEWEAPVAELRKFVNTCPEDTAQAEIPGAVPLPVDVERIAAMAASPEPNAQVLAAWSFSILALDDQSKPRVRQSGAHSALASAMQSTDPDIRRFAARALLELWEMESSAAHNTAQAMELRLAVADEMLQESFHWDADLKGREEGFQSQLQELQPTVDVRGEALGIDLGFLSEVVEASSACSKLRTRLCESQQNGLANCKSFGDSTNDSQARSKILADSRAGMLETLQKAKELSANALGLVDFQSGGEEDEAVQLQRVKQMLKNQLDETAMKKKEVSSEQEELTVQEEEVCKEVEELTAAVVEGPQRQLRLEQEKVALEGVTQNLGEQLAACDTTIAEAIEEMARLNLERKKLGKKEARVSSLQETLQTMQDMEAENRKKAEELAAMDEMMRGKMDEMQKMQKMMSSMMAQVMAGMGDLDGNDSDDEPTEDEAAAERTCPLSEAEKQKKMITDLVAKVAAMGDELKVAKVAVEDKIAAADAKLKEAEAEKARLTAEVQTNAAQIATVSTDLENCGDPAILEAEKVTKIQTHEAIKKKKIDVQKQLETVTVACDEARTKLEEHETSVGQLHSVVHDTHLVMADWEVKMRKHVQKRKRLMALSNTFGVDIQDVQNRANDEQTHWKESLKPLIQNAIGQLGTLLEQLDKEP